MSARQQVFLLDRVPTPIGAMLVVTDCLQRLRALDWEDHEARMQKLLAAHYGHQGIQLVHSRVPAAIRDGLKRYLEGELNALDAIEVATAGTSFQRDVWNALRRIPAGSTWSYRQLASRIGRPAAVRAVGLANGANPISVVIPCHRVIGSDGSLTGYGGGLRRKQWLLQHEGAIRPSSQPATHADWTTC